MRAGELNTFIGIYRPKTTTTAYGSEATVLEHIRTVRASCRYGRGWRSVAGSEVVYSKSVYFTVRPSSRPDETDILQWAGCRYRIIAIEDRTREREVEITAEKINE